MLTEKEIDEIRAHLDKAQNPVFYYDNDADGLCSFILLRKYIGRGKGVAVRSFPDLNGSYARKAGELNADYAFVLDKPVISEEFINEIDTLGIPLVWIDHHDISLPNEEMTKKISVYNPARKRGKDRSEEPVTYMCYKIANRKEDIWLAIIGCIADHYLPEFVKDFEQMYPELWYNKSITNPFDAYYKTGIGEIARALNFGLKDSVSNVVKLQSFLINCSSPLKVFEEEPHNFSFRTKYKEVKKKYDDLLAKAKKTIDENLIFFDYSGDLSISADISNELSYLYPGKYISVAYKKGTVANLSLRGKNVKKVLERVLKEIDGTGGGHDDAVGARIEAKDLEAFREALKREIDN